MATDAPSILESLPKLITEPRLVVLRELQDGDKRVVELQHATETPSGDVARAVAELEDCGFLARRTDTPATLETDYQCSQELTGGDTPRGYYSLTPKGAALGPVFAEIEAWATEWLDDPASADS